MAKKQQTTKKLTDKLKTRLINKWMPFDQSFVDSAISQWHCI